MRGKLNLFQATMLWWRDLHPYNAVHVVAVRRPLEALRLKSRIAAQLESAGLTGFVLDRRRGRFEYRGGSADVPLAILAGGDDPRRAVERAIEHQLNLPFPSAGPFLPFRFFAVDAIGSFHLGLAYDHFVAGGDSIAVLLGKLVESYGADAVVSWAPRLYPHLYARLFARQAGYALAGLRRFPALAASCRRSYRAPSGAGGDARNGFLSQRVATADVAKLAGTAKGWGVTRNDLFFAMLLLALSPAAAQRVGTRRRNELGVAAIVNVRGEFEADARDCFGQFLAALRVSHPVPSGVGLRELAQAVHAQTQRYRREKLYLQTLLGLSWAALAWRFLNADRRQRYLGKHYPIWAGVTSLDVEALWPKRPVGDASPEYLRAVPTGPLAPLVLAITTLGGVMQLGVSFRRGEVDREFAERIAGAFVRQIQSLAP